jgi:hypothetical protein
VLPEELHHRDEREEGLWLPAEWRIVHSGNRLIVLLRFL